MGMPATGKHISVEAADIGRIGNGLAKERWGGLNVYSMLTQLGVIPAPQRANRPAVPACSRAVWAIGRDPVRTARYPAGRIGSWIAGDLDGYLRLP